MRAESADFRAGEVGAANLPAPLWRLSRRGRRRRWIAPSAAAALIATACLGACSEPSPRTPYAAGRQVYLTNCVVCHNPDPNLPGSQGPPIAGSSRELLEARVLHLAYPPGYKPKRNTHAMRAFPELAAKIDDLAAFLAAAKDQKK